MKKIPLVLGIMLIAFAGSPISAPIAFLIKNTSAHSCHTGRMMLWVLLGIALVLTCLGSLCLVIYGRIVGKRFGVIFLCIAGLIGCSAAIGLLIVCRVPPASIFLVPLGIGIFGRIACKKIGTVFLYIAGFAGCTVGMFYLLSHT